MERLTERRNGKAGFAGNSTPTENMCKVPFVLDRLAAYEETGLSPDEIKQLAADRRISLADEATAEYLAYLRLGTIDDLTALAKARDDGRVVVLPCKVGERVIIDNWPYLVEGFLCSKDGQWKVRLSADVPKFVRNQRGHWYMSFKAFERKTRAEVDAAMKGENHAD